MALTDSGTYEKYQQIIAVAMDVCDLIRPDPVGLAFAEITQLGATYGMGEGWLSLNVVAAARRVGATLDSDSRFAVRDEIKPRGLILAADLFPVALEIADSLVTELIENRDRFVGGGLLHRARITVIGGGREFESAVALRLLERARFVVRSGDDMRLNNSGPAMLPSALVKANADMARGIKREFPQLDEVFVRLKDQLARATDGRPKTADALQGFGVLLSALDHAQLATWWRQVLAAFRSVQPDRDPFACTMFAWSLAEGALVAWTCEAPRRGIELRSPLSDADKYREWTVPTMAGRAQAAGVITADLQRRLGSVIEYRNMIHAAGLVKLELQGAPLFDVPPAVARDASIIAEHTARAVADWLAEHPRVPAAGAEQE